MEEFLFNMAINLIYWRQVSYYFTVIKSSESVTIFNIEHVPALTHGSILVLFKFFLICFKKIIFVQISTRPTCNNKDTTVLVKNIVILVIVI